MRVLTGLYLWFLWLWNSGHDPDMGNAELRQQNEVVKRMLNVL